MSDIIKKKPLSKVYMYTVDKGHGFDFDNVKVLDPSYSTSIGQCAHSFAIQLHKPRHIFKQFLFSYK